MEVRSHGWLVVGVVLGQVGIYRFILFGRRFFTQVAREAGSRGPGLVSFVAVLLDAFTEPIEEVWDGVAVPLLQRAAADRGTDVAPSICQGADLVHQVRV